MKLYEPLPKAIEMDGVTYDLQLHFDRVLRYLDLIQRDDITAREAAEIGCEWFVIKPKNISANIGARLIEKLFKEVLSPPKRTLASQKKQPRTVDFTIDSEAIYASFMRDYGIDLISQRGIMHWCSFIALFNGLSDETPIKQIMRIRMQELPQPTKSNAKQRQRLLELKTLYALPNNSNKDSGDGWDRLFNVLMAKAKG